MDSVPIKSIRIAGFKSIREAKVDLAALNVLIGPNGTGKSNFVGVFELLNRIADQRMATYAGERGGVGRLLHFGRKRTPYFSLDLEVGGNWYKCRLAPTDKDLTFFSYEECGFEGAFPRSGHHGKKGVYLGSGHVESRLIEECERHPGGIACYVLDHLRSWRVFHFHDTSTSAGVKAIGDLNDNRSLRDDAANLAAFLYLLRQTDRPSYDSIVQAVRRVAPFFRDFALEPLALNPETIRLEWSELGSDDYFDAASLSDGTLRFICLCTLLLQPTKYLPSVILIDEPELGLHPAAIALLAELLRSASKRAQVIVSTQSVTLVNQLLPEEVIVVEKEDGASTFRRLDSRQLEAWLGDYGLGDLWEKNLVGGRP